EDSLTNYNIRNRIINYDEQTKQVAALDTEYDLRYQNILLNYNSANAAIYHLESQLDENLQHLRGNAEFLAKLTRVSELNTRVAELGSFFTDTLSFSSGQQQLGDYKQQLEEAERDLMNLSHGFANRKYTREGYPTSNFVTQWLEELLKLERAKAEIGVLEKHKQELDERYSHFSPIGSTIKRQERSIDFIERNYLSILHSLNGARLRLKSLEMNSASLKLINPPVLPLNAEPSKRKNIVMVAYAGSLVFLLGFFLLTDLLDRTLRDPIRTQRITGTPVLGTLPGRVKVRHRRYNKVYREKAARYIANALQGYFNTSDFCPVVNIISVEDGAGKTFLTDLLSDYWNEQGIEVHLLSYGKQFDPASSGFLFAETAQELVNQECIGGKAIVLVEHAALEAHSIPSALLQGATINLVVTRADRGWKENDKHLFSRLREQAGEAPVFICLNRSKKEVVESFAGMLPPYTAWRRFLYRMMQFSLTSSNK
ncbi:MAG: exopolysaccharide biosynthesis protein, partial [Proteiniphilum sp.]